MHPRNYAEALNQDHAALAHTFKQTCARLNIGKTLLRDLIDRKEIRTIRLGHRILIPETELQRLITSRLGGSA